MIPKNCCVSTNRTPNIVPIATPNADTSDPSRIKIRCVCCRVAPIEWNRLISSFFSIIIIDSDPMILNVAISTIKQRIMNVVHFSIFDILDFKNSNIFTKKVKIKRFLKSFSITEKAGPER